MDIPSTVPSYLGKGAWGHAVSRKRVCPTSGSSWESCVWTCSQLPSQPPNCPRLCWHTDCFSSDPLLRLRLLRQPASGLKEASPCCNSALGQHWGPGGWPLWGLMLLLTSSSHFWFFSIFLFPLGVCEHTLSFPVPVGSPPAQAHYLLLGGSHNSERAPDGGRAASTGKLLLVWQTLFSEKKNHHFEPQEALCSDGDSSNEGQKSG